jgi:hypothetical protein
MCLDVARWDLHRSRGNNVAMDRHNPRIPLTSVSAIQSSPVQPSPVSAVLIIMHYVGCPQKLATRCMLPRDPSTTRKGTAEWYLVSAQGSTKQGGVTHDLCSSNEGSPDLMERKDCPTTCIGLRPQNNTRFVFTYCSNHSNPVQDMCTAVPVTCNRQHNHTLRNTIRETTKLAEVNLPPEGSGGPAPDLLPPLSPHAGSSLQLHPRRCKGARPLLEDPWVILQQRQRLVQGDPQGSREGSQAWCDVGCRHGE